MYVMVQHTFFRALQHGLRRHGFAPIPSLSGLLKEVEEVVGQAGVLLMEGEAVSVRTFIRVQIQIQTKSHDSENTFVIPRQMQIQSSQ